MSKPILPRSFIFSALCGLILLGGCFSATPSRPTKDMDASTDVLADVYLDGFRDTATGGADGRSGGTGGNADTSTGKAGGATTVASTTPDAGGSPDAPLAPSDASSRQDTNFILDAPDASDAPFSALLGIGSSCARNGDCASTYCVDGVCCDGKCEGNCESCATGTCAFSSKPKKLCAGSGKCAGSCAESNTKTCTFPDDETVCAEQSCTAGVRTNKAFCDGEGGCRSQGTTECAGGQCLADGSDCANCTDDTRETTCAGGRCGPTVNNCGRKVDCPASCSGTGQTCGGGGNAGFCGCISASKTETCGTFNCGTAMDNCGKEIKCGDCVGGGRCLNGTCCAPACTNRCGGDDGCGGTCPNTCPGGLTCGAVQPNVCGCAPDCNNKCGGVSDGCNGTCSGECGGNSICQSGACRSCGSLTACGGSCVNTSTSAAHCGQCDRKCSPGQSCCSGTCVDLNSSGANCGTCGHSCGSQTCMVGICCDATSVNCGGSCCDPNHSCTGSTCGCPGYSLSCGGCPVWNFETRSTEGWIKTPAGLREETSGNAIQSVDVTTSRFEQGIHSLAVRISTNESKRYATIAVPLCPSGAAVSLPAGITFSASFFFASDGGFSMPSFVSAMVELLGSSEPPGAGDHVIGTSFPDGTWFTYRATFPDGATASHVAFFFLPGGPWTGTMYMDRVRLSM